MRDNNWLKQRLKTICEVHFANMPQGFPIEIRFGIRARYRFGSIAARNGRTLILINRLFADTEIPDYVVDSTIGHEMAHYVHGFGSGLPRLYADPHRGGVVDRELEKRGLAECTALSETWRKANWEQFYNLRCGDITQNRAVRSDLTSDLWQGVLRRPGSKTEEDLRIALHRVFKQLGVAAGEQTFDVGWLEATRRQAGTSYWYPASRSIKLHGLLSDLRVPSQVIEFELAYWTVREGLGAGRSWPAIQQLLLKRGFEETVNLAWNWRRKSWTAFRNRNHPLR